MKKIAVGLSLVVALALPTQFLAHEGHKHKVMGTVTAVDASHVEIDTKDEKKVSILVTEDTKYMRGKEPATAADVKVGDRIVVTTIEKEGKKIAQEILLAPARKEDGDTP